MWIIHFIPDWSIHLLTLVGICIVIAAFILSFITFISKYKSPALAVGILATAIGVFFEGMLYCDMHHQKEIAELERKLQAASAEIQVASAKTNTEVVVEYVTKVVKVKEKTDEIIKYVDRYVDRPEVDAMCDVPNAVVVLHNAAAENTVPPSTEGAYEGASEVKISELTGTVVENYGTCYEVREQVLAWQKWYTEQQKIYNSGFACVEKQ